MHRSDSKIHWVNVVSNLYTEQPEVTGESEINVMVNRTTTTDQIVIVQRVSKYFVGSLIGVTILEPLSNKSSFAMNNKETDSNGTVDEKTYRSNAVANFRKLMADINSTELFDDHAEQLVKQVTKTEARIEDGSDQSAMELDKEDYWI